MKCSVRALLSLALVAAVAGSALAPPRAAGQALAIGSPAPELVGGPWIGSPPLTITGLRGKVVLVDFWTYG